MTIENVSIHEILANVCERQTTASRRLGQKIKSSPDAKLGLILVEFEKAAEKIKKII